MPTYDYECEKCGHEFEEFQSITAPLLTDCPECNARNKVRRLIGTGAGIIFKGSGFYETDYKRKSSSGKPASDTASKTTETKKKKTEPASTKKGNSKEAA